MADQLKSGLILKEGEKLVIELEAEMWATSQNPIAKAIGQIRKIIGGLLGSKRQGYIVITDKRVVEIVEFKACWVFNLGKNVKYVLPSSVKEVGYTKEGTCFGCFCRLITSTTMRLLSVLLSSSRFKKRLRLRRLLMLSTKLLAQHSNS